jgi:glycosyltransferase involved in cell wall biosynthesis
MPNAFVIIYLPVFNVESVLSQTLDSLVNQTYNNYEIHVSYDKSTDRTLDIIKGNRSNKIKIFERDATPSLFGNMNQCIKYAQCSEQAKYITLYNADDIYDECIIEKQVKFLERNINSPAVFTEGYFIDEYNNFIGVSKNKRKTELFTFQDLYFGGINSTVTCLSPTFMVRRSILTNDKTLLQRPELFGQAADFGFYLHIAKQYGPVGVLKDNLIKYRVWAGGSSAKLYSSLPNALKVIDYYATDPLIINSSSFLAKCNTQRLKVNLIISIVILNIRQERDVDTSPELSDLSSYRLIDFLTFMTSLSGAYLIYKIIIIRSLLIVCKNRRLRSKFLATLLLERAIVWSRRARNIGSFIQFCKKPLKNSQDYRM